MNPHFDFGPPRSRTCSSPPGSTSPAAHTNLLSYWPLLWRALAHSFLTQAHVSPVSSARNMLSHTSRGNWRLLKFREASCKQAKRLFSPRLLLYLSTLFFAFSLCSVSHCIVPYLFIGSPARLSARWGWGFHCSGFYPSSPAPAGGGGGLVTKSCLTKSCRLATPWTVAHQPPMSVGFSRQVVGTCK